MSDLFRKVLDEFEQITTFNPRLTSEYASALNNLCQFLECKPLRSKEERARYLIAHINRKFRLNRESISVIYAKAAMYGITFNYHEKEAIQKAFDLSDKSAFIRVLNGSIENQILNKALVDSFYPIKHKKTIEEFIKEVSDPSKLRKEKGVRQIDRDILLSALSSFVFSFADEEILHSYFDNRYSSRKYKESFWLQLRSDRSELYNRERTLEVVRIDSSTALQFDEYAPLQSVVMGMVYRSYSMLNNHGYLAIWIDPLTFDGQIVTWQLAEYIKIFAEKLNEIDLKHQYFKQHRIAQETFGYVHGLNSDRAQFNLANEGFTYRDCFVLSPAIDSTFGSESLLILFQKNQRDETLIPCPACRSHDVQGNSYSTLGVRSWECRNPLCPERSKYNRGKRYSFKSILMQEAITHPNNLIHPSLVRSWARDIQIGRKPSEIIEMLICCYSLYGDSLHFFGFEDKKLSCIFGRQIYWHNIDFSYQPKSADQFSNSAWFHRYIISHKNLSDFTPGNCSAHIGPFQLIHGDARAALCSFNDNYFDGAITSPPYYNAREYAQWPNIYCYLYDMFGIIKECYRVLKYGSFFLFNIFDHFDNERSITFSAMGNKRLVLSSMLVDLFLRAGFILYGNVVWDKGEIEGKRAFNGGNFSPYYQSPFNCWEHILVFGKHKKGIHTRNSDLSRLPSILRAQPVFKIKHGENHYGHTAPFPEEVPSLLAQLAKPGSIILDPFGGSGTTARALCRKGMYVVCIERDRDYCNLAERMFRVHTASGVQGDLLFAR